MSKSRFADHECPVARGLDQIGDWWTLLIIREALYGLTHFEDIRKSLGISRAVLSNRLKQLTKNGILQKHEDAHDARAAHYSLTEKGRDLWPILLSLLTWSNKYVLGDAEDIVNAHNKTTGAAIASICAMDVAGQPVAIQDTVLIEGQTASSHFSARIRRAFPREAGN